MRHRVQTEGGYTLIELLVSLVLLTTLLAWAIPAMAELITSARIYDGAHALAQSLMLARSEAVRRNGRVVVCQSAGGQNCDRRGGWEQGWIIFHDPNNNGRVDANEGVLYREPARSTAVHIVGNRPVSRYVSYTSFGRTRLISGAFQAGTFTVCAYDGSDLRGRKVVINSVGRARVDRAQPSECR